MEDNGLLHTSASPEKTLDSLHLELPVGAYWVHSEKDAPGWDQLRLLVLECPDLPVSVRKRIVEQVDVLVRDCRRAPAGQPDRPPRPFVTADPPSPPLL